MSPERDPVVGPRGEVPRQRVVRVPGQRRARLTPAPGSADAVERPPGRVAAVAPAWAGEDGRPRGPVGPNDERMLREVPPHY